MSTPDQIFLDRKVKFLVQLDQSLEIEKIDDFKKQENKF
jgi:hypothetical protein